MEGKKSKENIGTIALIVGAFGLLTILLVSFSKPKPKQKKEKPEGAKRYTGATMEQQSPEAEMPEEAEFGQTVVMPDYSTPQTTMQQSTPQPSSPVPSVVTSQAIPSSKK